MLFSIIIPVFNSQQYIVRCLNSIINQKYKDFEVIIIDDGSTDASGAICDSFAEKDKRIFVEHCINGGVVKARKRGVEKAKGDYVVWVDSDDYISDNYLELFAKAIEKNNPDVISCGFAMVNTNDEITKKPLKNKVYKDELFDELKENTLFSRRITKPNLGCFSVNLWAKAIKTDLARKYQLMVPDNIRMGEDIAVIIPLLFNCSSVEEIEDCGYYYQNNPSSMSYRFDKDEIKKAKVLVNHLNNTLGAYKEKTNMLWYYFLRRYVVGLINHSNNYSDYYETIIQIDITSLKDSIPKDIYKNWNAIDRLMMFSLKNKKYKLLYYMIKIKNTVRKL